MGMFDEDKDGEPDMVELLEELTLGGANYANNPGTRDDKVSVRIVAGIAPADASRRGGVGSASPSCEITILKVGKQELSAELSAPLQVGDHYRIQPQSEELRLPSVESSTVRCCACMEADAEGKTFRVVLRPYAELDVRRALSGG